MNDKEEYELLSKKANVAHKRKMENGKYIYTKTLKDVIITVLVMGWFIGSFFLLFYFSEKGDEKLLLLAFGQYFAVFSLIFFCGTGDSLMPLLHYTVGVLCMTVPFLLEAKAKISDMGMNEKVALGSCIVAIFATYYLIIKTRNKEKNREVYFMLEIMLLIFGVVGIVYWCRH